MLARSNRNIKDMHIRPADERVELLIYFVIKSLLHGAIRVIIAHYSSRFKHFGPYEKHKWHYASNNILTHSNMLHMFSAASSQGSSLNMIESVIKFLHVVISIYTVSNCFQYGNAH